MNNITFCIPSKNNLRYLKSAINSIQKNSTLDNEIIVWVDLDEDGTVEWLKTNQIKYLTNPKETPQGIAFGYNRCIEASTNEIVCMFHADMFMGKGFDTNLTKHLKPNSVVAGTRIEPPLHPQGKEKIVKDFGLYPEDFQEENFNQFVEETKKIESNKTTQGIFAPWACYKKDILSMGLHDEYFHSYHEDSDIFNRFILNKMEIIQSRDALVYHLTCRGGKWIDGIEEETKDPSFHLMAKKAARYYLRKWGSWILNNEYQMPIINPKYDIGFVVRNNNTQLLEVLEPWCSTFYGDGEWFIYENYTQKEQPQSNFNLKHKIKPHDWDKNNYIIVEIDGNTFNNQDFNIIQQLSAIIQDSGELGEFELGNLKITINDLTTFEKDLIFITNDYNEKD